MAEINKSVVVYKNCEVLPVYNFMKIINTDNLYWLIKGYEDLENESNQIHNENLPDIWRRVIQEYLDLKKDSKVLQSYNDRIIIKRLEDSLNACERLLGLCTLDIGLDNIEKISNSLELHNKRCKIDLSKPLYEEKKRVKKIFVKMRFKIDIENSKFEKNFNNDGNNKKLDIYEEMANLEQSLKRNEIDPKTTVVAKWIALINLSKKVNG